MADPAIEQQILDILERLSPEKQKRAAEWVHGWISPPPQETQGRDLLHFAGTLDDASARQMMDAIEKGCEQVVHLT